MASLYCSSEHLFDLFSSNLFKRWKLIKERKKEQDLESIIESKKERTNSNARNHVINAR